MQFPKKGTLLCERDGVSVWWSNNRRLLRFGDENGVESAVHCKGTSTAPSYDGLCQDHCGSCPCDYDPSFGLGSNYTRTMFAQLRSLCTCDHGTRVLSIGLGGGDLPQYLLRKCPQMQVETVELNPAVISAARDYFGLHGSEQLYNDRISVEEADALDAVERRPADMYDAVLIDCFAGGGLVPETCRSQRLAEGVNKILKPQGVLLQNIWHYSSTHAEVATDFAATKQAYQFVFAGNVDDIAVPMRKGLQWVDILKATKPLGY